MRIINQWLIFEVGLVIIVIGLIVFLSMRLTITMMMAANVIETAQAIAMQYTSHSRRGKINRVRLLRIIYMYMKDISDVDLHDIDDDANSRYNHHCISINVKVLIDQAIQCKIKQER